MKQPVLHTIKLDGGMSVGEIRAAILKSVSSAGLSPEETASRTLEIESLAKDVFSRMEVDKPAKPKQGDPGPEGVKLALEALSATVKFQEAREKAFNEGSPPPSPNAATTATIKLCRYAQKIEGANNKTESAFNNAVSCNAGYFFETRIKHIEEALHGKWWEEKTSVEGLEEMLNHAVEKRWWGDVIALGTMIQARRLVDPRKA